MLEQFPVVGIVGARQVGKTTLAGLLEEQSRSMPSKRTVSPAVTPSMRIALEDLRLDRIDVLHAGRDSYPLGERVRAVSTYRIWTDIEPL